MVAMINDEWPSYSKGSGCLMGFLHSLVVEAEFGSTKLSCPKFPETSLNQIQLSTFNGSVSEESNCQILCRQTFHITICATAKQDIPI